LKTKGKNQKNSWVNPNMKPEIDVGDIVVLNEWCTRGGELAIIVERHNWDSPNSVKIMFLNDMDGALAKCVPAVTGNLTKLERHLENQRPRKRKKISRKFRNETRV